MKFFILGCNGMAGHIISLYLKEQGHKVLGFDRTKSKNVDSITGDAFDTEFLRKFILEILIMVRLYHLFELIQNIA